MGPNGNSRTLLWIVLGAFVLRLGFGLWWHSRLEEGARLAEGASFFFGDSESYWELGRTIAASQPYQFRSADCKVFRTPGYPLLLSPAFLLGGEDVSTMWGQVISALFGTLAVATVWWLARTIFDDRTAWWAAAIAAIYPGAIATSGFVLAEAPFGAVMILQLACWYRSDQARCDSDATWMSSISWALAAGAAAGAAALLRPSWLLFTPFAGVVWILFRGKWRWQGVCTTLAVMLVGMCVVMSPWWIRNAIVIGRFVPTTLQVGASLYDGLNPTADGSSNMVPIDAFAAHFRAEGKDSKKPGDLQCAPLEYRLDRAFRRAATTWARLHPEHAARLVAIKFRRLWNIWPNEPSMRSWPVRLGVMCGYMPVLMIAIWSAWRHRRRGWAIWLCLLPAVYFTLLHVVFVSSIRYRQPAMLALIVLAAGIAAVAKPHTKPPLAT